MFKKEIMKEKYFKKLREKSSYFLVVKSWGLFGSFHKGHSLFSEDIKLTVGTMVLAYNQFHAVERFLKRNNELVYTHGDLTTKQWAKFRVVPKSNPYPRFVKYIS